MNRRKFLVALAAGTSGLAGCLGDGAGGNGTGTTGTSAAGSTATGTTDADLPIPKSELSRGAAKNAIPAITDPAFDSDWSDLSIQVTNYGSTETIKPRLEDDDEVIGVERDGSARAYPLRVLDWHEIVNDDLGGPLLVTYCPLCGSGMTAVRKADGETTVFGVSGYLYQSDLVMYDEATDSLWSQIMATAIRGDLTGETLTLVPSTITTWGSWTDDHPDTEVLLPPPESGTIVESSPRDYTRSPYGGYGDSRQIGIGNNTYDDDRLHPKATVIGITDGSAATAYPLDAVSDDGVVNDTVGSLPVVVTVGSDDSLHAYERSVDGETLTFDADGDSHMTAGGSRWKRSSGEAVSGSHEGTTLTRANDRSSMFFFAWKDFNEDTTVYGQSTTTT
jgi:hypothetical protein